MAKKSEVGLVYERLEKQRLVVSRLTKRERKALQMRNGVRKAGVWGVRATGWSGGLAASIEAFKREIDYGKA